MESQTYIKNLKISPKKLRFLLPEIKKLKPGETIDYLSYMPNRSAKIFYKVIKSAISNAKNKLKTDEKALRFKLLTVEEGQKLKRYKPGGKGMVRPILRRFSHVKIILEAEKLEGPVKETVKNTLDSNPKSKIPNPKQIQITKSKVKNKKKI